MPEYTFAVTVDAPTQADGETVLAARLEPDEMVRDDDGQSVEYSIVGWYAAVPPRCTAATALTAIQAMARSYKPAQHDAGQLLTLVAAVAGIELDHEKGR